MAWHKNMTMMLTMWVLWEHIYRERISKG